MGGWCAEALFFRSTHGLAEPSVCLIDPIPNAWTK